MNILKKIILFTLIMIINIGCVRDGQDGEIFIRFRAVLTPLSFFIDNPEIPVDVQYDVYYKISPGVYPFTYTDHNNIVHPLAVEFGLIDVISDPGQSGSLLNAGEDGKDLYIDLILLSTGPIIENFNYYTIASTLNYDE